MQFVLAAFLVYGKAYLEYINNNFKNVKEDVLK